LIAEIVSVMTRPPVRCGKSRPSDDRCGVGLLRHRQHTDGEIDVALMLRDLTTPRAGIIGAIQRTLVDYRTEEPSGTIVIDTANGKALRYGIGVGREGFTWSGTERISRMAEWPDWNPPPEMIERQPYLPRFMAGGPGNPLGARALYLGKTVYRIHGTNQPSTIGTFVSSGCIRLTNRDIMDLYTRVQVGTRIVVLASRAPATAAASPAGLAVGVRLPAEVPRTR
jgi:lipoprotein-anchoring transpeptidase ErfK/SrfK